MGTDAYTETPLHEQQSRWAGAFARLYEPSLWVAELVGMRRHRRTLLGRARGCVLEIGAGTGLNVPHYPPGLSELILAEPDAAMRRRLERRTDGRASVIGASADELPVTDASLDTVVSTFVLCTVEDPAAVLREIRRVLRPGGELLLIEHVLADARWLASLQRLLRAPWASFACGCRCDQPTVQLLHASGFRTELEPVSWRAMPPVVRPVVVGRALLG